MKSLAAVVAFLAGAVVVLACVAAQAAGAPAAPYPKGYREWTHVKSMVIEQGHPLFDAFGGLHHLYANGKAMEGYRSGRFADGAVIVFDLLEAREQDHAIVAGSRKVVGVMRRDTARYAATGGWGFEAFKGDSKTDRAVGANAASACFECHRAQQSHQYVFSTFRP